MQAAIDQGEAAEAELAEQFTAGIDRIDRCWTRCSTAPRVDRANVGPRMRPEGYSGMADITSRHPDFRTRFDHAAPASPTG